MFKGGLFYSLYVGGKGTGGTATTRKSSRPFSGGTMIEIDKQNRNIQRRAIAEALLEL
jgi:hypothetical protein